MSTKTKDQSQKTTAHKAVPIIPLPIEPDIAANIVRLCVGGRFRDEQTDTRLIVTLQSFTGVYELPAFERLSRSESNYYSSHREKRLAHGVEPERAIASFFLGVGQALEKWCEDEGVSRLMLLEQEKAVEGKKKEKEKQRRARQKERAQKANDLSELRAIENDEEEAAEEEAEEVYA